MFLGDHLCHGVDKDQHSVDFLCIHFLNQGGEEL